MELKKADKLEEFIENLLNLKNLKELDIKSTRFAQNEEQLALIYQQFPDIEIQK